MTATEYDVTVSQLTDVERLRNSRNGNPRYRLVVDGKTGITKCDAGWVYALDPKPGLAVVYRLKGRTFDYVARTGK